jgi:hypothetical protein
MLNEYTDLNLMCLNPPPGTLKCDPLGDFNSPQTLEESVIALAVLYFACYAIALVFMKLLSRKFE